MSDRITKARLLNDVERVNRLIPGADVQLTGAYGGHGVAVPTIGGGRDQLLPHVTAKEAHAFLRGMEAAAALLRPRGV
jgi:hypothetical protein